MNLLRREILKSHKILPSELNRIISTAPHRYKVFYIEKKKPGEMRQISQPSYELKVLQRWLVSHLSEDLPIHDSAIAYREGIGIKDNANRHARNNFVLKMDINNFFPSITAKDLEMHILKYENKGYDETDISDICRLALWAPKDRIGRYLCIGAPSSPFISNSIFYDIDVEIDSICSERDVIYTRYADDLVFSTNHKQILGDIEHQIYRILNAVDYPKLSINKNKTIHTSKGRGVMVTGVVITPSGKLSIGRDRKRLIRSTVHHFLNNKLEYREVEKLNGLLAFSYDIDPEFICNIKRKYGEDILSKIRTFLSENGR